MEAMKSFNDVIVANENSIRDYANESDKIRYITPECSKINNSVKNFLNGSVDRIASVQKLDEIIMNMTIAVKLESGIFEYTLIYSTSNNIMHTLMPAIYNDKVNDMCINIQKNQTIAHRMISGEYNPQCVPFLKPSELNPQNWELIIKKNELMEFKKNNMAATDIYKCFKCGEKKCKVRQLQTRSADEPMTTYVTCLVCGNVFKK